VRDRYPAYISWDTFEKIQTVLCDNRDFLVMMRLGLVAFQPSNQFSENSFNVFANKG
jgi:hypothetical protein